MNNVILCTKQKINHVIEDQPENFEVIVCLKAKINNDYGWFISPDAFKQKIQSTLKNAKKQMFLSKNHSQLIDQLQNALMPHTIHRIEIKNQQKKLIYEA